MRYFIAGNAWLFVTLAIILGRHVERTGPTRVSFFGVGTWFAPPAYWAIALISLCIGVTFLVVAWKQKES